MPSSGKKCYHEVRNVIRWEEMLLGGKNVIRRLKMLSGGKKCHQEVRHVIRR